MKFDKYTDINQLARITVNETTFTIILHFKHTTEITLQYDSIEELNKSLNFIHSKSALILGNLVDFHNQTTLSNKIKQIKE